MQRILLEDWYLESWKVPRRSTQAGKTFKLAAEKFRTEYEAITAGERN